MDCQIRAKPKPRPVVKEYYAKQCWRYYYFIIRVLYRQCFCSHIVKFLTICIVLLLVYIIYYIIAGKKWLYFGWFRGWWDLGWGCSYRFIILFIIIYYLIYLLSYSVSLSLYFSFFVLHLFWRLFCCNWRGGEGVRHRYTV